MLLPLLAVIGGLALLVWSADRFVDGAAATAGYAGVPPLLIGMVIIGFGTSAPEMVVSAFAAWQGNPALALGNAYGSNIANIALILGLTAVISPIMVISSVLRKELPVLAIVTGLAAFQLWDGFISRRDAWVLLAVFASLMAWSIFEGLQHNRNNQNTPSQAEAGMSVRPALFWLFTGLVLLVISSRVLVWGAVEVAHTLGVSDLIIGLTVVAVGTSLPELASSLAAIRKNEHDLALGNVLGSNLFNTLAVVGIAGAIEPMVVEAAVLYRDWSLMAGLTFALFVMGRSGRISRVAGGGLLTVWLGYTGWLVWLVV